ncbi:manganese-dependent ADP-ribose/CDP-alcohol diphosphatase [Klebsormidium nitens]|uniref:Manganese-dependent ADP-ribose/CDP-alcohol diphosphatase n=1 Tax=Klebsormidium nitens TaxID=105231 RepID=A0A1Y1I2G7_KLENI|nr:manganese-dependent ADP-ribose/CDP-alcohol diphosphatase [Klebsormidium nitens]|eukprot:GAQ84663.1 manganese-dependent ADP-ribose/CDP-alcohol diphosphatase [Klebsormidium nitens]
MSMAPTDVADAPLFSFGVVADIQYADKENGSYESQVQRYREAPGKFEEAVHYFNSRKDELLFLLTLGDIIDGNVTPEKTEEDFKVVLGVLDKLQIPAHHLLGNHCLSLPRERLLKDLKMPARYSQHKLPHKWRLVILDTMDVSVRWPEGSPNRQAAAEFMEKHPLGPENPHASIWNGGVGAEQLAWLTEALQSAERLGEKVIVCAHHPLVAGSAAPTHLVWNHEEVAEVLERSPAVAAYFCGHYHIGGYAQPKRVHYCTFEAILEAPTDEVAHAVVRVFPDKLVIEGQGTVTSRTLQF